MHSLGGGAPITVFTGQPLLMLYGSRTLKNGSRDQKSRWILTS